MAFNRERFKQLVLYISWATRNDPEFGRTKLAKTLFYSDLATYAETGKPLTGATYWHYEWGPYPPVLRHVEKELEQDRLAHVERLAGRVKPAAWEFKVLPNKAPVRPEDPVGFLVDSYITKISEMPTWKVSDQSHEHPGWALTGDGETIPYHVAFMSRRKPTEKDFARVRELAAQHGWD